MRSIYKSEKGQREILELYDKQLSRLTYPYRDIWLDTSFGKSRKISFICSRGHKKCSGNKEYEYDDADAKGLSLSGGGSA